MTTAASLTPAGREPIQEAALDARELLADAKSLFIRQAIGACPSCEQHFLERRSVLLPLFERVEARPPRPALVEVAIKYFATYHAGGHRLPAVFEPRSEEEEP